MREYRFYILDTDDRIESVEAVMASSDAEAAERAREKAGTRPYELWAGPRIVIKYPSRR